MKQIIKTYTFRIIGINLLIIFLFLILIQLELIDPYSALGFISVYILFPLSLLLFIALILILAQEERHKEMSERMLAAIKGSNLSFLIFLFSSRLQIIEPYLGYVYIYIIFPYILFLFLISIFIFFRKKESEILKKFLLNSGVWFLVLVIGTYIINF